MRTSARGAQKIFPKLKGVITMAEDEYNYNWAEDEVYPCDISGICPGYGGCSKYPECVGWKPSKNEGKE